MIDGYVADVPYVRTFTKELAPAWLDHAALVSGFTAPNRNSGFAWCDLGCGHGLTSAVLGAAHPQGEFHGIDANEVHVESANRFASDAGVRNVSFHAARFDEACDLNLPAFDYIVSHGVYSWVDEAARTAWRRFIERHLKPGGLLYLSYNAMPGRAADLPLQRLVRALGLTLGGNSQERTMAAIRIALRMAELKAPALAASPFATSLRQSGDKFSPGYLTHELMVASWEPHCVTEVRAALAPIGLRPAGSATLVENYDSLVLGRAAREALRAIEDPDVRELARDFFIDQFFRRDVFVRGGERLDEAERRRRLFESAWFLARPANATEYRVTTPAGEVKFDNPAARHIVSALAAGPRRLADIALTAGSIPSQDLLANALVLTAAGAVWPVEGGNVSVANINEAIARLATTEQIPYIVQPFGTAVADL